MDGAGPLSVLLLCDDRPDHADNVRQHIAAFARHSRHRIETLNPRGVVSRPSVDFDRFDVIVIHYTLVVTHDAYLSPWFRERIADCRGLKVQFIQDEYRWVDAMTARIQELGIHVLYSLVPEDVVPAVYGPRLHGVDVKTTLAGFVPTAIPSTLAPRPLRERPVDVVYRGRAVPFWLGRLGQEKLEIARGFSARSEGSGLRVDIAWSEPDRIYGAAWYRFLASARATLSTESGASVVDFDGSIEERTNSYLSMHPTAGFEEVEREVLAPYEGNVRIEVVSPRVFEAAVVRTAMVNFRGRYSDVIEPWRHYVPLEKDFSNFDEVLEALRDHPFLERLAEQAHTDVVASGRYSLERFVSEFDADLAARVAPRRVQAARHVGSRARSGLGVGLAKRSVASARLRDRVRRAALDRLTTTLIRREAEVHALARLALAEADGDAALERRARHDLVRLAVIVSAHRRTLRHQGPAFDVSAAVSGHQRATLSLVSVPLPAADIPPPDAWNAVRDAIATGRLDAIVWYHSPVGLGVRFPILGRSVTMEVGYYAQYGTHRFTFLERLARRHPVDVARALAPLFEPRGTGGAEVTRTSPGMLGRVLAGSRARPRRALTALRLVLTSRVLRRLFLRYLRDGGARSSVTVDGVVKDLVGLRFLHDVARGRSDTHPDLRLEIALHDDASELRYRTSLARDDSAARSAALPLGGRVVSQLERIVWDNSVIGDLVDVSWYLPIAFGESGTYEFTSLVELARRFPSEASEALDIGRRIVVGGASRDLAASDPAH